jgi:formate hydrogenlyase subunit 6/NADH:ubiquinone oxidoreductase subunit I
MRFGTMLPDVWGSFFRKPVTQRYPFERLEAPDQYRGKLVWTPGKCNGCCLCMKDCPANAIELLTIDKKNKQFVMRYHADRCTYCAQCVQNCRLECLGMDHGQWETAGLKRETFVVNYGSEADLAIILAKHSPTDAAVPAASGAAAGSAPTATP